MDLTTLRTGVQLRMEDADTGTAGESCASNDGAAVQLIFHIPQSLVTPLQGPGLTLAQDPLEARQPPSLSQEVAKAREVQARWRLEEVRRNLEARSFNIRLNSHIDVVKARGIWDTIGSDSRFGLPPSFSAWMSTTAEGGFDHATAGKVVIIKADAAELEGEIDLVMQSWRWVKQTFKVKVMPRNPLSICG